MVHKKSKSKGFSNILHWGRHLSKDPKKRKLQEKILHYLYEVKEVDGEKAKDHEMLTITIQEPKNKEFAFLRDHSRWEAVGSWVDEKSGDKYMNEKNTIIQVEFLDTKNEKVGKKLMKLFDEYNKKYVGEQVLYVRTEPVEESSLKLFEWRGGK